MGYGFPRREANAEDANNDDKKQKLVAVEPEKSDLGEVGKLQVTFTTRFVGKSRSGPQQGEDDRGRSKLGEFTAQAPGICQPGMHSESSVDHSFKRRSNSFHSAILPDSADP